ARESEDPEHQNPMSVCSMPRSAYNSAKHGISISTPFVVPSVRRTGGACAKPTTATSVTEEESSLVVLIGFVVGVGLTRRPGVVDVVDAEPPLLAGFPPRLDPHSHSHVGGFDLSHEVQERDVGAVEQNVGRNVRRLDARAPAR